MLPFIAVVYLALAVGWGNGKIGCDIEGALLGITGGPTFTACLVGALPPDDPSAGYRVFCDEIMPDDYDGSVAQAFMDACELTLRKTGFVPPLPRPRP